MLVVLDVASPHPLRFAQASGSRVPVHTSAMGKVLLAFSSDPAREVRNLPTLTAYTGKTITDTAALVAELDQIRSQGWSVNDEERNVGVRAVAAPVLAPSGTAVAAVAVQGPTVRITNQRISDLGVRISAMTRDIAPLLAITPA